ncbi:hypothetical protein VTG60DRAFT_3496 [Thermothelomyces hinnuleus]
MGARHLCLKGGGSRRFRYSDQCKLCTWLKKCNMTGLRRRATKVSSQSSHNTQARFHFPLSFSVSVSIPTEALSLLSDIVSLPLIWGLASALASAAPQTGPSPCPPPPAPALRLPTLRAVCQVCGLGYLSFFSSGLCHRALGTGRSDGGVKEVPGLLGRKLDAVVTRGVGDVAAPMADPGDRCAGAVVGGLDVGLLARRGVLGDFAGTGCADPGKLRFRDQRVFANMTVNIPRVCRFVTGTWFK